MKKIISVIMASFLLIGTMPITAFAKTSFSVIKSGHYLLMNGKVLEPNNTFGAYAYVPGLSYATNEFNANTIGHSYLDFLKNTDYTGQGSRASRAANRYTGFDGIFNGAQYLVKTTAMTADGSKQWLKAPVNINGTNNVNFRYAGLVINGGEYPTHTAIAGTNPYFTSDWVSTSASDGNPHVASVWNNKTQSYDTVQVYGTDGGTTYPLEMLYSNGLGQLPSGQLWSKNAYPNNGNIGTNLYSGIQTSYDYKLAQQSFEEWARVSSYGAQYKSYAEAIAANCGLKWWEVLNNIFQINGDITDSSQTVYFYCVGNDIGGDKSDFYKTYALQGDIENNVSPTLFSIVDKSGKVLGTSSRNQSSHDAYAGNDTAQNVTSAITLNEGEMYTLSGVLTYYAKNGQPKKTTANSNRQSLFCIKTDSSSPSVSYPIVMSPLSDIMQSLSQTISAIGNIFGSNSLTDSKASGPISATKQGNSYSYNGAAFGTSQFVITPDMPRSGYLVFGTSAYYTEEGDNDIQTDDTLYIKYVIGSTVPNDIIVSENAYGDMNLGRREYRSYHYIAEEERPDLDNPKEVTDPVTGEVSTEYPVKKVLIEYCSPYGTYENASDGEAAASYEVGEVDGPPGNDGKSIFYITNDSWWDYSDREWPDQTEDLDYKCWLERNGQWIKSGVYERSELSNNPFDLGFRVSRSKGNTSTVISKPTVTVSVYGVSPETGDDGEIIAEYHNVNISGGSLGVYHWTDVYMKNLLITSLAQRTSNSGNITSDCYPRIKVEAKIADSHDESGIYGGTSKFPFNNGREDDHDSLVIPREFVCESDDMRIMEIELRDSEGIVVYHADRYSSGSMIEDVNGYYDREEDLTLKVVMEQCTFNSHNVKNPTIDVRVDALNESGNTIATYINSVESQDIVLSSDSNRVTYDNIIFRPKNAEKLSISVQIDDIHGSDAWRENVWDNDDDSFTKIISATTADLALTQEIELYNSKGNKQEYLTFAEYLSFKYDIRHIGSNSRQRAVVGNSTVNPLPTINTKIFNADALTTYPENNTLVYKMATQDPKAAAAFLRGSDIQSTTRLYPGLGESGYASHVQAWLNNYIVQTYTTASGNIAAHGHILVTGNIDVKHDTNHTNIRDNNVDYVQQEFKGEKDLKIVDIAATSRNSITAVTGISVQVAINNMASSYNDQTIIDRTYLDILIDDQIKKTVEVDVPVGDTVVVEVNLEDVDLSSCEVIQAQVNVEKHQTHYEYVLKETDSTLFEDPFINNYASILVCANQPSTTICPDCEVSADPQVKVQDIFENDTSVEQNITDTTQFQVVYDSNDEAASTDIQYITFKGTGSIRSNMFTRIGYIFTGWNTDASAAGTAYAPGNVITVSDKQSYNGNPKLLLYAQWMPVTYTVSFDANGGTGSVPTKTFTYDQYDTLPLDGFIRYGYEFAGWNTAADGSGDMYLAGSSVKNLSDTHGQNVVLYAIWAAVGDCAIITPNFNPANAQNLHFGNTCSDDPYLMNLNSWPAHAYIRVRIPVVGASDAVIPNYNTASFTLISQTNISGVNTYIYRYNGIISATGTSGDSTPKLFTYFTVNCSSWSGEIELSGAVVRSGGTETIGTIGAPGSADAEAFALFRSID